MRKANLSPSGSLNSSTNPIPRLTTPNQYVDQKRGLEELTIASVSLSVENEIVVVGRLHEFRKEIEDFERHAEDENLVSILVPQVE